MDKAFWLERWERREIGFHQNDINPHLLAHWSDVAPPQGAKVLVPLCGKSRDMLWLRKRGHAVLGVELSPIAVREFFQEAGYAPSQEASGKFSRCAANGIEILCGDFFDLTADDLKDVAAVYDRASLVALPPEMRERYAAHLARVLPAGARILLVAFDYDQDKMSGPPFAVSPAEVRALYSQHADIRLLAEHDALSQNPRFRERGLTRMQESVFLLTVKPNA